MTDLPPDVEQQLASMSEGEWAAFTAKVRAPDTAAQLRTVAAKHISGERLESVLRVANVAAFTGGDGQIDEAKVARHLGAMFSQQSQHNWQNAGQHAEPPPPLGHADQGMNEAAKRFGPRQPRPVGGVRGRAGLDEAQRRFGQNEEKSR
jgi:hypothetical protein